MPKRVSKHTVGPITRKNIKELQKQYPRTRTIHVGPAKKVTVPDISPSMAEGLKALGLHVLKYVTHNRPTAAKLRKHLKGQK